MIISVIIVRNGSMNVSIVYNNSMSVSIVRNDYESKYCT